MSRPSDRKSSCAHARTSAGRTPLAVGEHGPGAPDRHAELVEELRVEVVDRAAVVGLDRIGPGWPARAGTRRARRRPGRAARSGRCRGRRGRRRRPPSRSPRRRLRSRWHRWRGRGRRARRPGARTRPGGSPRRTSQRRGRARWSRRRGARRGRRSCRWDCGAPPRGSWSSDAGGGAAARTSTIVVDTGAERPGRQVGDRSRGLLDRQLGGHRAGAGEGEGAVAVRQPQALAVEPPVERVEDGGRPRRGRRRRRVRPRPGWRSTRPGPACRREPVTTVPMSSHSVVGTAAAYLGRGRRDRAQVPPRTPSRRRRPRSGGEDASGLSRRRGRRRDTHPHRAGLGGAHRQGRTRRGADRGRARRAARRGRGAVAAHGRAPDREGAPSGRGARGRRGGRSLRGSAGRSVDGRGRVLVARPRPRPSARRRGSAATSPTSTAGATGRWPATAAPAERSRRASPEFTSRAPRPRPDR